MTNFEKALAFTLKEEGGYVNHPSDPGGATNFGITQKTYNAYLSKKGKPFQSVKKISKEEKEGIYKEDYWDIVKGDDYPLPFAIALFDFAVHSGPVRAKAYLARANSNLDLYIQLRENFLRRLNKPVFIRGWLARIDRLRKYLQEVQADVR